MPERYEIVVVGRLDPGWSAWFSGMELIALGEGATLLSGPLADQAALHGLLEIIRDLNLTLVSLKRVDAGDCMDTMEGD